MQKNHLIEIKKLLKKLINYKEFFSQSFNRYKSHDLKSGTGIDLSNEQIEAINNSLNAPVSIITGGPWSGKTTLVTTLKLLEKLNLTIKLCAPTGRAAKRIAQNHRFSSI